ETALQDLIRIQRKLVAESSDPEERGQLAQSLMNLSALYQKRARIADAEDLAREAGTIYEELSKQYSHQLSFPYGWSRAQKNLGLVYSSTGRNTDAERAYRTALPILTRLAAEHPSRTDVRHDLGLSHSYLGHVLFLSNRAREAESAYRDALKI